VPFATVPLGKTTFQITTSAGRSLQTYDLRKGLNLIFATRPQTPENITATAAWKGHVLAAWGAQEGGKSCGVWVFKRGQKVNELQDPHGGCEVITKILTFGSWIIGCCRTKIEIWSSANLEHYTTINPGHGRRGVTITGGICNMPTYLNKILVGTSDGCVEVWNVSTGKSLYTVFPSASDEGAVTVVEPTPALSLFAIAYASGTVVIHDVRMDRQIITLNTGAGKRAPVTSISFRTDGLGAGDDGQKSGVMATASSTNGDVTFWDLNNRGRKMGVLRGAHSPPSTKAGEITGGVSKIEFLAGQAIILTSGLDNSLKSWIFDEIPFSPVPRILHSRSGHAAPITSLQFLPPSSDGSDADGKWLLSASRDRSLWAWSLRRDGQSTELSQGNIRKKAKNMGILNNSLVSSDGSMTLEELKAPKITCMACSLNRDGGMGAVSGSKEIWATAGTKAANSAESSASGWESVVTGHKDDKFARTWFWGRKRAGRWKFETGDGASVTSVAISACGTFALVGSAAGGIDMFNLQSGMHRQRFPPRLTQKQAQRMRAQQAELGADGVQHPNTFARGQGKHGKAVTGIQVDSLNRTVISCGADGKVKFWDFTNGLLLHELDWSLTSLSGIRFHPASDLIALSCDDSSIRVVDTETKKLVRELWGCSGKIDDLTFSNDGGWIVAASSDSVIRVWDLSTGHLIEALRFRSKPTALAFSTTGEYLATAHEDSVGIHIWTNKTLFTHVPTRQIAENEIIDMDAPTASGEGGHAVLESAFHEEEQEDDTEDSIAPISIDQLSGDLLTLSLVPKSRWQTLLHLDLIRERNKPKEAPVAPKAAPFFLPSLEQHNSPGATSVTLTNATESAPAQSRISTITAPSHTQTTLFTTLIRQSAQSQDPTALLAHLSTLPPSTASLTIQSLDPAPPYTELITFIEALTSRLRQKRDFELVQTWMAVLLKVHGDVVVESGEVRESLAEWKEESEKEVARLGDLVGWCRGVGNWVGGI
jgi:U3 small nucleolar RNA-associated protein 21